MHAAYYHYAKQGFDRNGRTVKDLQREMEDALNSKPPSLSAIRNLEKKASKE